MRKETCPKHIQFNHSAYFKSKAKAVECAKRVGAKITRTNHILRGKGWLVYK